MRTIACTLLLALSLSSCNAQDKSKDNIAQQSALNGTDKKDAFEPKGNWTVNKEYDENGNIIKYDSIYSYSYSSGNGDTLAIKDVDSVIRSFQKYFEETMPNSFDQGLMKPYWGDAELFDHFFEDNYFHDRWKNDLFNLESRFIRMDSLRNKYLEDYYPELFEEKVPNDN